MKKAWHDSKQVIIHQAPEEPEDAKRLGRLITLLSTGIERLLAEKGEKSPESVDFQANVLVNTDTQEGSTKR